MILIKLLLISLVFSSITSDPLYAGFKQWQAKYDHSFDDSDYMTQQMFENFKTNLQDITDFAFFYG